MREHNYWGLSYGGKKLCHKDAPASKNIIIYFFDGPELSKEDETEDEEDKNNKASNLGIYFPSI